MIEKIRKEMIDWFSVMDSTWGDEELAKSLLNVIRKYLPKEINPGEIAVWTGYDSSVFHIFKVVKIDSVDGYYDDFGEDWPFNECRKATPEEIEIYNRRRK